MFSQDTGGYRDLRRIYLPLGSGAEVPHVVKKKLLAFLESHLNLVWREGGFDGAKSELRMVDHVASGEAVVHIVRFLRAFGVNAKGVGVLGSPGARTLFCRRFAFVGRCAGRFCGRSRRCGLVVVSPSAA